MRLLLLMALGCSADLVDLPPVDPRDIVVPATLDIDEPRAPRLPELPLEPTTSVGEGWIEGDPLDPCPDGDWAEVPTRGIVFYVRAGSAGDGSREHPFGTISQAVEAAYDYRWSTILVARGTYREVVYLYDRMSLIGACAEETVLQVPPGRDWGVVVAGRWTTISRVTTRGHSQLTPPHFLRVSLTLDQVVVESPDNVAAWVIAWQGTLYLRRSVLKGISAFEVSGTLDVDQSVFQSRQGVWAFGPGSITRVRRSRFEGSRALGEEPKTNGIRAEPHAIVEVRSSVLAGYDTALNTFRAQVELRESVVRDVQIGVVAHAHSNVRLSGTVISDAEYAAFLAEFGEIALEDVRIDRSGFIGLHFDTFATMDRVSITGSPGRSLFLSESSTIAATDLSVDDSTPQEENGFLITRHSKMSCTRCLIRGGDINLLESELETEDLTVDGGMLFPASDTTLSLERARLLNYRDHALVLHRGSNARGQDVSIERPAEDLRDPYNDIALFVSDSRSTFERLAIVGARGIAAVIDGDENRVSDLSIREIDSVGQGELGNGLWVSGGELTLERAEIARTRMVGIVTFGYGVLYASDLRIADTDAGSCTVATCPYDASDIGGIGLSATGASRALIERFEIRTSRLAGAQVVDDASLRLENGTIANNEIGVHGAVALHDVLFLDNRSNVDAMEAFTPPEVLREELGLPPNPDPIVPAD